MQFEFFNLFLYLLLLSLTLSAIDPIGPLSTTPRGAQWKWLSPVL